MTFQSLAKNISLTHPSVTMLLQGMLNATKDSDFKTNLGYLKDLHQMTGELLVQQGESATVEISEQMQRDMLYQWISENSLEALKTLDEDSGNNLYTHLMETIDRLTKELQLEQKENDDYINDKRITYNEMVDSYEKLRTAFQNLQKEYDESREKGSILVANLLAELREAKGLEPLKGNERRKMTAKMKRAISSYIEEEELLTKPVPNNPWEEARKKKEGGRKDKKGRRSKEG